MTVYGSKRLNGYVQSMFVLFVALLAGFTTAQAQTSARRPAVQVIDGFDDPASVSLEIYLDAGGSVRIEGYNSQKVRVYDESNSTIDISSDRPSVRIMPISGSPRVRIRVPYAMSVKIYHGANSGSGAVQDRVELRDVAGNVEVSGGMADVILSNISGSTAVNTLRGSIEAQFFPNMEPTVVVLTTNSGNVDVTLPGRIRANLFLWSMNGSIETDFDLNHEEKSNRYSGPVNGGGPRIELRVLTGDINVLKRLN